MAEFAFIGRSNVGKSSLINCLLQKKNIARVSNTPGKTQLINIFKIDENWQLTDLPGYGYAKISKTMRRKWEKMIESYILQRKNLICTFILIDSRLPAQKNDILFMEWMGKMGLPFVLVYTKFDKVKPSMKAKNIRVIQDKLKESWEQLPEEFITSSESGEGREELLSFILKYTDWYNQQKES